MRLPTRHFHFGRTLRSVALQQRRRLQQTTIAVTLRLMLNIVGMAYNMLLNTDDPDTQLVVGLVVVLYCTV
jgi:hypothetical protein